MSPDPVSAFYERYPYPGHSPMPHAKLEKFANQVLAGAGITTKDLIGKIILEAGCGTGEISCSMGMQAKKVVGIDVSRASIARAKALAAKHRVKAAEFLVQDLFSFHPREKFDLVCSFGVLHHTIDACGGFDHLAALVKKEGMLITGYYHSWGGWKQRAEKIISGLFSGTNAEKRVEFMQRFYSKQKTEHERIFLADRVANPRETYYRVPEIMKWYAQNGFEIIGIQAHKPKMKVKNVKKAFSILAFEAELFVGAKRFFIVAGKKKNDSN